ncbi:MAG: RNase adapter RapZ [Oscillospiraceae bacterium]|nr:RNase adapter RapZ [Oscillospiraceae bacterium]
MEILIISGLSGAGKSRVAAALEDLDFYVVDNMPVSLIPKFAELCAATRGRYERVALVTDVRSRESFDELFEALDELLSLGFPYKILYVDATVDTIVKRYKETRRRHPLDTEGISLVEAVHREIKILEPVRQRADYTIDTTGLTLGRLQRTLFRMFGAGGEDKIRVSCMSFGYKYGLPMEADIVFDVRFLPNPFYVPELRDKTGQSTEVAEYVFKGGQAQEFLHRFEEMLSYLMPNYEEEGKLSLTVAVGCTGGKHRSVAVTEALAAYFASKGYTTECIHRDLDKAGS